MVCGALWPDEPAPDGRPITCHLDKGHGGFYHRWDDENHVQPGEDFGDGHVEWPTTLGQIAMAGKVMTPIVVERLSVINERPITHVVEFHPTHVMLHANVPPKPVRR